MRLVASLIVAVMAASPALGQTLSPSDPRVAEALEHAAGRARALGAEAGDVTDLMVTDAYADARTGLAYVYIRQALDGIEVAGSEVMVAVGRDGRAFHAAGDPAVGLVRRAVNRSAALSPADAVVAAAGHVGAQPASLAVVSAGPGPDRRTTFETPETALAPLVARLVYHAEPGGSVSLAWEVGPLETAEGPHAWMVRVDARDGAELWRADLTNRDPLPALEDEPQVFSSDGPHWMFRGPAGTPDQYRVYPPPMEGPNEGERELIDNPADALASPYGWHDIDGVAGAEYTITRGNNVHAYLDTDNDGLPDVGMDVDGGPTLTFDFPVDLTQHPSTYRPAAVTNNFYWSNLIHDIAYQYGFTEAGGNFQVNNYGRGGLGNDDLRAEAQDGGGTNNANFSTPADGSRPRMQMYLYTLTNPWRDGDFSNMTLVHEYTHGISNRLTGGPTVTGCLSGSEQMGEGWSDWLAAMLTMETGDTRVTHRPYGTYPRGLDPNGNGLRPAALNTDFARNDYHYGHTRTGHPVNGTLAVPHGIGFVWSTVIWEVAWEMIDAYGFSPDFYDADGTAGNQMMMRLVIEGMKLQPCRPGFVTGRDAILAADDALYGGAHRNVLWAGFARRGVGFSASQGASTTNSDNMEAFDLPPLPPAAAVTVSEIVRNTPTGGTATAEFELANTAAAGSQGLNYLASVIMTDGIPGNEPFAVVTPPTGTVAPGGTDSLTITFDATAPPSGVRTATLRLSTTDPDNPSIDIPITMIAGGAVTVSGGPGWRMLGAPSPGLTVDSLALQNLVEGIPGYYPTQAPNIFTGFDGVAWTPPAGGADPLAQGRGFVWYFYDETFDPGGPSTSVALPMTIEAPLNASAPPPTVQVTLHAAGSGLNLVANPFRRALDVSDIAGWATGGSLASAVGQVWYAPDATFHLSSTLVPQIIAAWQGMLVENDDAAGLDIPASAQTDGAIFRDVYGDNRRLLALEVRGTDGTSGEPLLDRAIALQFSDGAVDGWDIQDASKLTPYAPNYVLLGIEGDRDGSPVLKAQDSRRFNPQAPFEVVLDLEAVGTGTEFVVRWPQMLNFPDDWAFELMDIVTLATVDMRVATQYGFTAVPTPPPAAGAVTLPAATVHAGGDARFVLRVTPGTPTTTSPPAPPPVFALAPPAPNPVTGSTQLRYSVPAAADVRIELFDLLGRRVSVLVDERVGAGHHAARLEASRLPAGAYIVRMSAGDFVASHRVVVTRTG